MRFLRDMIRWQTLSGVSLHARDFKVTPLARVLQVRLPFGILVWNSPAAVLAERDGEQERVPIVDVTRLVVLGLFGLSVAIVVASLLTGRRDN